jgi:hypothetical protein
MEVSLIDIRYVSNKGWVGGSNQSTFNLSLLNRGYEIPKDADLIDLWRWTPNAFGRLVVKERSVNRVLISLPPSTGEKLRLRFVATVEAFMRTSKK